MLKFYEVNGEYIDFLRKYEPQIPYVDSNQYKTYKNKKFFCGIVLNINGMNYFAPVSSYNKSNLVTFPIKDLSNIDEITNNPKQISSLRFSFMFPCPFNLITTKDFTKESADYKVLLKKELNYCNKNIFKIKRQAQEVYDLSLKEFTKNKYHICNFLLLEEKCKEWEKIYTILPFVKYIKAKEDLFFIYDNLNNKSNFEKVIKILDKKEFCDNIKNMNIKDLENKRVPSIDEISSFVYENLKDKYTVTFLDILDDVNLLFGCDETLVSKTNEEGKIVVPFTEKEIEELKNFTLKNIEKILKVNSLEIEDSDEDEDEL